MKFLALLVIILSALPSIAFTETLSRNAAKALEKMRGDINASMTHQGGRYYISFGSYSRRFDNNVIYPVSATLPSVTAGCNGIDVTMGGVSFMGTDYIDNLYNQMTDVNQYAAIATGLAVKMLSNELGTEIETLQDLITKMNNLQFDACSYMTAGATYVVDAYFKQEEADKAKSAAENINDDKKNLFEADKPRDREKDIEKRVPQLSSKGYLKKGGSLLDFVFNSWLKADNTTAKDNTTNYRFPSDVKVPELRALFGDVKMKINATGDATYILVPPCDKELSDWEIEYYIRTLNDNDTGAGKCSGQDKNDAFNVYVRQLLSKYTDFVVDNDTEILTGNKDEILNLLDILALYNITQLIVDSAGVGDKDYFWGVVEMTKPVSVALITYNYTEVYYDRLVEVLFAFKSDLDANGEEAGVALSSEIESLIEQVIRKQMSFERSRDYVYSTYNGTLEGKRREIDIKLNTSPVKRLLSKGER
jgi:conjugative transfer pilus assembly protein TraH